MQRRIRETLAELPWLVCVRDERVVGYAYASPHRERRAYQWSVEVSAYVAEDVRRAGIGRSLYAALIDLLRRQGYRNAYAGITLPNDASVGLHEALAFERIGVFRRVGFKLGEWQDVGWWQLCLADADSPPGTRIPFASLRESVDWTSRGPAHRWF